jgi:hypothetical protein
VHDVTFFLFLERSFETFYKKTMQIFTKINQSVHKLFILLKNPFLGVLALLSCTSVQRSCYWERINSERNKEKVKEALRREKRECSESKKRNR